MYEHFKSKNSNLWNEIPSYVHSFADYRFEHPKAKQHTIVCDFMNTSTAQHTKCIGALKKHGRHQHGGRGVK